MEIVEEAKKFAIMAHKGQVRKSEVDKPFIIHPVGVAKILEEYGLDEHVIAAGYLHDVVEDTKYTIQDIRTNFGDDIANLVYTATEPDKSLSWEERKQHTINTTKGLNYRNKAVICADKIHNLESLMILFGKTGRMDFSKFKRGLEEQRWYYTEVYKSIVNGENPDLPMFKRLKNAIDVVFNDKEDAYLKDVVFEDNPKYYQKLKSLHASKLELEQLKTYSSLDRPFIIEFTGTPRTGKTSTISSLYDFFKKGGFNIKVIEEFTSSKYYKEEFRKKLQNLDTADFNLAIMEKVGEQLKSASASDNDIVIIDRSISDRQIWNMIRLMKKEMFKWQYDKARTQYIDDASNLIDYLVILYADAITALKRDYNAHLSLEQRNFLNEGNLKDFNDALARSEELLFDTVHDVSFIDTAYSSIQDTSVMVASDVMPIIRKRYLDSFKKKYK